MQGYMEINPTTLTLLPITNRILSPLEQVSLFPGKVQQPSYSSANPTTLDFVSKVQTFYSPSIFHCKIHHTPFFIFLYEFHHSFNNINTRLQNPHTIIQCCIFSYYLFDKDVNFYALQNKIQTNLNNIPKNQKRKGNTFIFPKSTLLLRVKPRG